ncbi:MAG: alpha/beta hydrolase family protein [Gaiellales bacterium]
MRRLVALIALALLAAAPTAAEAGWRDVPDPSAQPDVTATTTRERIGPTTVVRSWYDTWNGHRRELRIAVPTAALAAGRPVALLVTARPAGLSLLCTDETMRLAGRSGFALACPSGQGVVTRSFSYGAAGQISDLARMPGIVAERIPDLRINRARTYLAGSSMGGTEVLLVALRYPRAYARVASLDPITDQGLRFASLPLERRLLLQAECGGPPVLQPGCYATRSPQTHVGRGATAGSIALWYSTRDPVSGEPRQVPRFAKAMAERGARGFAVRVGRWGHGALWGRAPMRRAWMRDLGLPVSVPVELPFAWKRLDADDGRLVAARRGA